MAQCQGWDLAAQLHNNHNNNVHLFTNIGGACSAAAAAASAPPPPPPSPNNPSASATVASSSPNATVAALIERLAGESAVVLFSVSTCCMCHVVKQLLGGLGVNLTVYEVDELVGSHTAAEAQLLAALASLVGSAAAPVPAVFVGGKLVGGLDHVMAAHISGALVPLLKQAGALWL